MSDYWQKLYRRIEFLKGEPVVRCEEAQIAECEKQLGFPLPESYREFIKLFGPGELAGTFQIYAPGCGQKKGNELVAHNRSTHEGRADEVDEYAPDPGLHRRFLFFGDDVATNDYAWDPTDVSDANTHEYAIHVKYRTWDTKRLAGSFDEFVRDIVFGARHTEVFDDPPDLTFMRQPS